MKNPNRFIRITEKIMAIKHIKSVIAIVASLCICIIVTLVGLNVFGAQKDYAIEETTEGRSNKQVYLPSAEEFIVEDPIIEETEAETEQDTKATEIIPVQNLVISTVDLSVPEENVVEVVDVTPEEIVSFPTNEISKLVYGIDVSKWQGNINWAQVKADGIDFAIIKMGGRGTGSGDLYVDEYFEKNIQGAIANGIQVGVYFFSQAVTKQEALEEASMVVNAIKKYNISYPVAFDWESADGYRVNNYNLSRSDLTGIATVFCDAVSNQGYTPMVYFNRSDWYNAVNGAELSPKYKSWYAIYFNDYYKDPNARNRYNYGDDLPSFKYSYQMWQYTSRGHVAGINGHVDMDIAFFTYANYKVDKTPVTLTVPNTSITTNAGTDVTAVDLMAGVSATNSIGYNATQNVNLTIIDSGNGDVNKENAISNPGVYKLNYSFTDPTGEKKEVVATLTVRDVPKFTMKASTINYTYATANTESANYDALVKLLKDNIVATSYEGKILPVQIKDLDTQLKPGTYTVSYYAEDGLGLSKTETVTVTINKDQGQ